MINLEEHKKYTYNQYKLCNKYKLYKINYHNEYNSKKRINNKNINSSKNNSFL